jgi:O-antigen polysaccharide polymerase Wzy
MTGPAMTRDESWSDLPQTLLLAMLALAGAIQYMVWSGSRGEAWAPQLFLLAIAVVSIVLREKRVNGTVLSATGVAAMTVGILFVLRPAIASSSGVTNAGAAVDARPLDGFLREDGRQAIFEALLFACALGIGSTVRLRATPSVASGQSEAAARAKRSGTILGIAALVAALADTELVHEAGGPAAYISGISSRSSFLSGNSYLTLAYLPLLVALVHHLVCRAATNPTTRLSFPLLCAIALLAASTVIAGGRAQLVLGFVLPLVLLKQYGKRPFKWWTISILGGVTIVLALIMGLLLRDNRFDGGASYASLKSSPVQTLGDRISSGIEMRPFDSVLRLNEGLRDGEVQRQDGSTYLNVPTWFVPRKLWSGKPYGGGNTWFTSKLVPRFYGPDRVETSLSAIGESFANFGYVGIIVVGALTGAMGAFIERIRRRRTLRGLTICITVVPLFASFIRGDAYQNAPLALATIVLCFVVTAISRPSKVSAPPTRAARTEPRVAPPLRAVRTEPRVTVARHA